MRNRSSVISFFQFLLMVSIFPLYLVFRILSTDTSKRARRLGKKRKQSKRISIQKNIEVVGVLFFLMPLWIGAYALAGYIFMNSIGFIKEPQSISGTGSMHPTFPKGEGTNSAELSKQIVGTPGMFRYPNGFVIAGKRFFGHTLGRGDIVVVENEKIRNITQTMFGEASGWVKRIVGMSGDTIELRDGTVYLNDQPLAEPYTAKSQSTFGETYLSECKKITVPPGFIFIMGDNRKGSGDSREIGFVEMDSVNHVIPFDVQRGNLDKTWRDTTNDFDEASKIRLDKENYLALLNEKRKEAGVKPLVYQSKLENSAKRRGEVILKYDDFSFEATRSGYTMARTMNDARYSNTVWGEAPALGYYEADELIENQFQFPESKKFLLDKTFQEVGIAEVRGELNGCPTQVLVQHFAGYVPPNYSKDVIDSWKSALRQLREVQSGWGQLKEYFSFYDAHKDEVNRINDIIAIRISNIEGIVAKMEANQWLTSSQNAYTEQDKALYDEQQVLATKLNSY